MSIICKVFCFTAHAWVCGRCLLFEKNVEIGYLLDFYGDLLKENRRTALDLYYNSDMSLAEISAELGITRQGVRDLIVRGGDELLNLEQKLRAAEKFRRITEAADKAAKIAAELGSAALSAQIADIQNTIKE